MEEWFLLIVSACCSSTQDHTQWAALPSIINQEMPPTDLPIIWVEAFLNWGSSSQINRAYLSWQNVIQDTASRLSTQTANRLQFPQLHKNLELTVLPGCLCFPNTGDYKYAPPHRAHLPHIPLSPGNSLLKTLSVYYICIYLYVHVYV